MQTSYSVENLPNVSGARVAVLQSKWHKEHTDRMIVKCKEVLEKCGCTEIEVHVISGSLEIPLAAQRLARLKKYDALIAFGVIIKGDTYHFEMITNECMRGLGQVMLAEDIPIINEILPVTDIQHVLVRTANDDKNKGIEAAIAVIETISWRRKHPLS